MLIFMYFHIFSLHVFAKLYCIWLLTNGQTDIAVYRDISLLRCLIALIFICFHVISCIFIDLRWFLLTDYWWTDQLTDGYSSLQRCLWLYLDVWDLIVLIFMCFHVISCIFIDLRWFLLTGYWRTDQLTDGYSSL